MMRDILSSSCLAPWIEHFNEHRQTNCTSRRQRKRSVHQLRSEMGDGSDGSGMGPKNGPLNTKETEDSDSVELFFW